VKTYLIDTETCGFYGVPVTIQWALLDGPVHLHHIWLEPIEKTVKLIEEFVDNRVVFHNARFDWFHLSKIYHMLTSVVSYDPKIKTPLDWARARGFGDWAQIEMNSPNRECLKPRACVDTLLLASRCREQSFLMASKPVWVRRVPVGAVGVLKGILEEKAQELPWIMFADRADPCGDRWSESDCTDRHGDFDPSFKDLKLSFKPSKSLKHLAAYLCDHNVEHRYEDIAYATQPAEEGFAPFVMLLTNEENGWLYDGKPTWPLLIEEHINHWATNTAAQEYAEDDITMLRKLYQHFGSLEEDEDSLLACQVASVRIKGFAVDLDGMKDQLENSLKVIHSAKINVDSSKQVLDFVAEAFDTSEQFLLADGCDQKVIDEIKKEYGDLQERETCPCCEESEETIFEDEDLGLEPEHGITRKDGVCQRCNGLGYVGPGPMPVVARVEHVELVRKHKKRRQLFDKILLAKRAYPDFNVIGAKSGRMSGSSGLNFHGVDSSDEVRALFTLADAGLVLSAGDYSSQELAIAATTMCDDDLMRDMESGQSLHAMFAAELFETTYEEIIRTYKERKDKRYGKGKAAVYLTLYGGTFATLAKNCGVEEAIAEKAYNKMIQKYPMMGSTRKAITKKFSSITQDPEGKMRFKLPENQFINSIFGYKRYFDAEYMVQKMIWDTVKNPPEVLCNVGVTIVRPGSGAKKTGLQFVPQALQYEKVQASTESKKVVKKHVYVHRDRQNPERRQTMWGATSSALYGCCFSIQNQIIRASNNHVIQSTGRHLTVGMQSHVWKRQPQGIHPFVLWLMSIHDELAVVSGEEEVEPVKRAVQEKVEEQREHVPLTSIEWFTNNKSWAEKGDGQNKTVIGWQPEDSDD
jgi:hypothetical protein